MRFRSTTPSEKRLCSLETNKPVVGSGENLQEPSLDGQTHRPRDESNVGLALSNEGSELNLKVINLLILILSGSSSSDGLELALSNEGLN